MCLYPQAVEASTFCALEIRLKVDRDLFLGEQIRLMQEANYTRAKYYEAKILNAKSSHFNLLPFLKKNNPMILRINDNVLRFNDFKFKNLSKGAEVIFLTKRVSLEPGKHDYEMTKSNFLKIDWLIVRLLKDNSVITNDNQPEIIFQKISPVKYSVSVKNARDPFWLIFSESFHEKWMIYREETASGVRGSLNDDTDIVAEYPGLNVKEAKSLMEFSISDWKFLFKKPLNILHRRVNGYANGWYINPSKLGLGEDFNLLIFFVPQSFYCLGGGISIGTLMLLLLMALVKNKFMKKVNFKR